MTTTAKSQPVDWREGRRLRAWDLHQQGWTQSRIAEALGVTQGAVSQWLKRAREGGGSNALRRHPPPGRRPALTTDQQGQIPALLARGAEAYDFRGDIWTTSRVAAVLKRVFGVRYHPAHVSRLLRRLGLSVQKPITRASQRNEAAIQAWLEERLPAIKKKRGASDGRSFG
jgi:transposase